MIATQRIERTLVAALAHSADVGCPVGLAAAIRHAVMPGGARVRPRLSLAIAAACGGDDPALADAAAASIEFLHCASLVHDDLPCFDDATVRRGRPSVHCAFGERLAILTGDALIVLAFETLARAKAAHPERLAPLLLTVGRSVGVPFGIAVGQAWECEPSVDLDAYHKAKTGALFVGAAAAGAAAGDDPKRWTRFGDFLGLAYQTADDLQDALGDAQGLGKPVGRDSALARPNAVAELGASGAVQRVKSLIESALAAVPECAGDAALKAIILEEVHRFLPRSLEQKAA